MIDISAKIETLRTAIAETSVFAKRETLERALKGDTPKGEVLPVARVAAVMAAKKTPDLIAYCHPLAIDSVKVDFELKEVALLIRVEVKAIGRTGVEMEALTAASMAALNVYDMLKGIDKEVAIGTLSLLEKHGGKSDFQEKISKPYLAAVLVSSNSVSAGKKTDKSGKLIVENMKKYPVEVLHYEIVPDEPKAIQEKILSWCGQGIQLILTTGGTGLGPQDITVETVKKIIDREIPGIAEAMRVFGQRRTPYAMLSRSVVGLKGDTLIVTLPGSSRGVEESLAAIFPNVLHLFPMIKGGGH
ncbi:MAG: bifunctional molybdenum cofactor biosynthesis protein MoaC/MoaB [Deltaproteobacteria bacterium RIFCSPLOWO2_12_FULL_40_28]|nr:MAG: bifunctional molybdenum cofactor biosynthesis protein MoaC/MoaB [Deltaproteobacteria bacterium RIFCSPHIGHO2_02_FULL_40_28]OGQ19437.1 MAG: bifunctional molybdenum cofactor biosynthesis protein MoaC/MoaB [Deltaproteobacteria bacterium RIFCSPHIGHO2_12_FULL_40_32]OGQ39881.1 MAG: bifunctional molybdenum cofactor biosynthesis protein MoaC/MoaB [Deltaproteobacteria bacterium RIFCSPLOWO2_02_FULL_40_36]OGQ53875.1 MAG: bifunctional molybdenum cofactor biosynthesis protein MoaC/MoaB [Deltaproteobac